MSAAELQQNSDKLELSKFVEQELTEGAIVISLDTKRGLNRLLKIVGQLDNQILDPIIDTFNQEIITAFQESFTDLGIPLVVIPEADFYSQIDLLANIAINRSGKQTVLPVNLDRFISPSFEGNCVNLSVGRLITPEGEIIAERYGDPPLSQQLEALRAQGYKRVCIIDDGLFTPECLDEYQKIFPPDIEIDGYYVGISPYGEMMPTKEAIISSGKKITSAFPCKNMFDWVCGRDATVWGGINCRGDNNELYTIPYFAPFSDGSGASIPPDKLIPFSYRLLMANLSLIKLIQVSLGKKITFADFQAAGYGILASTTTQIRPAIAEEYVDDYLTEAIIQLQSNFTGFLKPDLFQQIPVVEIDPNLLSILQAQSEKLVILCGSSGTGRSRLTREVLSAVPYASQLKRITTRPLRDEEETTELSTTSRKRFLEMVRNGEIIASVNYSVNNQLYGIPLQQLAEKLTSSTPLVVVEGTGDVLQLKKLLPNAKLVMVLPPSVQELENRLANREGLKEESSTRHTNSVSEISTMLDRIPDLISEKIVDMVIINDSPEQDATKITEAVRKKQPVFENLEKLKQSLKGKNDKKNIY